VSKTGIDKDIPITCCPDGTETIEKQYPVWTSEKLKDRDQVPCIKRRIEHVRNRHTGVIDYTGYYSHYLWCGESFLK